MNDEGEEDFELVSKMAELYDKLGISVYDANGELKNTFGLLESLAEVYPTLTNAEKAYVTETIAGKYQAQNAAAILQNFQVALDATATAYDSTGSAARENEKVLDSIEGKIASFSSAFEELSQNLVSSDLVKGFVSLGTAILNILNIFDGFIPKLALAITVFGALSKGIASLKFSMDLLNNGIDKNTLTIIKNDFALVGLNKGIQDSIIKILAEKGAIDVNTASLTVQTKAKILALLETNKLTKAQQAAVLMLLKQNTANVAAAASTVTLTGALKSLWAVVKAHPFVALLSVVTAAFSGISSAINKANQEAKESAEKAISEATDLDNKLSSLDDTIAKIRELREILDDSTSSYTDATAAREQLNEIQKQLIKDYGLESDEIDLVNDSLEEQIKTLKELRALAAQDWLDENRMAINDAEDAVYGDFRQTFAADGDKALGITPAKGGGINKWDANVIGLSDEEKKAYQEKKDFYDQYLKDYENIMNKYGEIEKDIRNGKLRGITFISDDAEAEKNALEEWKDYLEENEDAIINSGILSEDEFDNALNYIDNTISKIEEKYGTFFDLLDTRQKKELTAAGFEIFEDELNKLAKEEGLTESNIKKLIGNHKGLDEALEKNGYTIDKLIDDYQNYETAIDAVGAAMGDDFTKDIAQLVVDNNLTEKSVNALLEKYPELKDKLDDYGMSVGDFVEKLETLIEEQNNWTAAVQEFNEEIDEIQDAFDVLNNAQNEYNENGYITIDTLQQLLALEPEYLDLLVDENGKLNLNRDAFKDLAQARIDDLIATEEQRHYDEVYRISTEKTNNTIKKAIGWFSNLWNVIRGGKVAMSDTTKTLEALEKAIEDSGDEALKEALKAENKTHEERMAILKATKASIDTEFSASSGSSKSSKSSSSSKEWWEEELDKLKQQFDYSEITIEEYIAGLNNLLGRVEKGSDAWREINDLLQEQRLDKVENDYKQGIISLDEYINRLKELIKVYKQGTQAWDDLADKIKDALQDKLDQQKDDLETAEDAAIGLIDEEIKKLEELRDAEEERYDQLIADKEAANEETERELELARLEEALENAKNEKIKRVWREGLGWQWEADQEAIKEAQEALDEFKQEEAINDLEQQKEDALAAIDEQINGWEDYKEAWESVVDDYETEQERLILAQKLGAEIENQILQQKIEAVNKYKEQYLNTMKELQQWEEDPVGALSNHINISTGNTTGADTGVSAGTGGSSVSGAPSLQKGANVSVKSGTRWYSTSYGGGASGVAHDGTIKYINTKGSHPYNIDGKGWVKKTDIVGYKNGGVVDYTGLAMLHGTPSSPEFVLNNEQAKKIMSMIMNPHVKTNSLSGGNTTNNYNFGDIELPNVHNAQQFMSELKSLVNTTRHQAG